MLEFLSPPLSEFLMERNRSEGTGWFFSIDNANHAGKQRRFFFVVVVDGSISLFGQLNGRFSTDLLPQIKTWKQMKPKRWWSPMCPAHERSVSWDTSGIKGSMQSKDLCKEKWKQSNNISNKQNKSIQHNIIQNRWGLCGRQAGNKNNTDWGSLWEKNKHFSFFHNNIFLLINFIKNKYLFAKVTHRTLTGCNDQQRVRSCSGSGTSTSRCAIGWGGKSGRWGQKSPPSQVECRWSWTTGCSLAWKGRRQREGGVIRIMIIHIYDTVEMIETSLMNNSVFWLWLIFFLWACKHGIPTPIWRNRILLPRELLKEHCSMHAPYHRYWELQMRSPKQNEAAKRAS